MNTSVKTVAELEAELNAARQALEDTKRAEIQAARDAELEAARIARLAKHAAMFQGAVDAINAAAPAGEAVTLHEATGTFYTHFVRLNDGNEHVRAGGLELDCNKDRFGGKTHYAIIVGSYGDKKRFPQLKTGGFSYDKIAIEYWARVKASREQTAASKAAELEAGTRKQMRATNAAVFEACAHLNYKHNIRFEPSSKQAGRLAVRCEFNADLLPAQVEALQAFIVTLLAQ